MMQTFALQFWHWLILAALLAGIEIVAPGFFFLWLGGAALVTGLIALILPGLGWDYQVLAFALLSGFSVIGWYRFRRRIQPESDDSTLNRRGAALIGRIATLREPIVNGQGRIELGDSVWRVEGEDQPIGTRVRVSGIAGASLKVERAV